MHPMQRNVYLKNYIALKITPNILHASFCIFSSRDLVCRVTCDTVVAETKTNESEGYH